METNVKAKYSGLLRSPRVTEKASFLMESNVYTFEVSPKANKKEIAGAVKAFYGVTPIKVNIVKTPSKKVIMRGKKGFKSAIKKAYVFLKKGDKIE